MQIMTWLRKGKDTATRLKNLEANLGIIYTRIAEVTRTQRRIDSAAERIERTEKELWAVVAFLGGEFEMEYIKDENGEVVDKKLVYKKYINKKKGKRKAKK